MNTRRALILVFASAIDAAVAQFNTTAPTAAVLTNAPTNNSTIALNTTSPTRAPSLTPSKSPTNIPTSAPSNPPTNAPTTSPSNSPTNVPTNAPTNAPTNVPTNSPTNAPTNVPTNSPTSAPTMKTDPPSVTPSLTPSRSSAPSAPPTLSSQPTPVPTVSFQPTAEPSASPSSEPTQSNYPSFVPTVSAAPSGTPSVQPTEAPIIPPSAAPSMEERLEVLSEYTQNITATNNFDSDDIDRFCRIYTQYTIQFGYNVAEPQISTKCTVKGQSIDIIYNRRQLTFWNRLRRMLQTETTTYNLILTFVMKYSTKVGVYNLDNYNALFAEYVNSNTTKVLNDMLTLQLPVLNVSEVVEQEDISPTKEPTYAPQTEAPVPISEAPSTAPSALVTPVIITPETSGDSFVLGLSLGLSGAFVVAAVGFAYYRHLEKQKQKDEFIQRELSGDNNDMDIAGIASGMGDSMEVKISDHNGVLSQDDITNDGVSDNDDGGVGQGIVRDTNASLPIQSSPPRLGSIYDIESGPLGNPSVSSSVGNVPVAHPMAYATMDSIFSQQVAQQAQGQYQESFQSGAPANLMMADASFSSDSEDELNNPSAFDGSHDELDNYKNHDLEILRDTVEEAVEDVEGMLSLAMTRALTEGDEADLPWGADDSGSIEASCLFETYDWLKRNEESPLDTRNEFFQEVINGVVITVLFGLMHPLEAAQLAHEVATVIGLPLLKELPKKTLVITGMRKTTDVDRGQHVILAAFERFGPIEQAAISPNNRGFGFVRFSKPKSVQRALEKYRVAEIEIQNVSVSIKTLENTTPARE